MVNKLRIDHLWLLVGVLVLIMDVPAFLTTFTLWSAIGVLIGGLVTYTSAKNLGWIK